MKFSVLFLIFLIFMQPFQVKAEECADIFILPDEVQEVIDNAYFVGMVSGSQYIQEYPSGNLKEAGLKPFFVYKAAADAKLNELIIVTHEDQDCNIYPPAKNEYSEVIIIKQDGKLILRRLFFFFPEEMDKLRQNMRYVGAE